MASSHLLTARAPHDEPPAGSSRRTHRPLLWQLFVSDALVLVAAVLVLILTPVRVSENIVLREVLILCAGLTVLLAVHLLLLRRTLAPLRLLTHVMGTIDARRPGRRIAAGDIRSAELVALTDAFNAMLDRLETERRDSARRALAAQEDERLRIAREMHDQIGQTLTALTIQAERAAESDEPVDRATLDHLARTALESLDDVRRIGRELRPEALDDLGLGNALIALCRRTATQGGVRVTHGLSHELAPLRPEVELVIYRVAQEALTNALRHAQASHVHVSLRQRDDDIELTVTDDGAGLPDSIPEDTAGVSGMRERALLIGGRLALQSEPTQGTAVELSIPCSEAVA
jgi:two-component system sensor histidine kinase UhpB